jgi:hypothetical protein
MPNPWRDLDRLSERGWSIAVTGHEDEDGEPDGITLSAEKGELRLKPVFGKTVAEAVPELERMVKLRAFAGIDV